jgi:hypothetical protein
VKSSPRHSEPSLSLRRPGVFPTSWLFASSLTVCPGLQPERLFYQPPRASQPEVSPSLRFRDASSSSLSHALWGQCVLAFLDSCGLDVVISPPFSTSGSPIVLWVSFSFLLPGSDPQACDIPVLSCPVCPAKGSVTFFMRQFLLCHFL